MQVKVGSGVVGDLAAVEGDAGAGQGLYLVRHYNATQTLVVPAADGSNARIDRVILRIYDDESDSSGNSYADLEIVEGTPAGTPSAPDIPDSAISLATIEVGAGVSAITDADITSTRTELVTRGQHVETVTYTANGTFKKADYPWLRSIRVRVQGGGGGGGGAEATGGATMSAGGGGGGGGYAEKLLDVDDLVASETVTVGGGGAGGSATPTAGGTGSTTSFGTHVHAGGGGGGGAGTAETSPLIGGTPGGGGTPSGDINVPGNPGGWGLNVGLARGGFGGGSHLAGGVQCATSSSRPGTAGNDYGGGGSGGQNHTSQATGQVGGAGGDGVVIVDLYA